MLKTFCVISVQYKILTILFAVIKVAISELFIFGCLNKII